MSKRLLYITVLGMALTLVGCAGKLKEQQQGQQQESAVKKEEEVITGESVSYLTGLPISE